MKIRVICSIALLFSCASCVQEPADAANEQRGLSRDVDLDTVLSVGSTSDEVRARIGPPHSVVSLPDGGARWTYTFKEGTSTEPIAVLVTLRSNQVARWSRIYHLGQASQPAPIAPNGEDNSSGSVINVWTLIPTNVPGSKLVDTKEFPKLGFIGALPDLVFRRLQRSESHTISGRSGHNVTLELLPDDARKLHAFTKTNISKQIVLMLDDEPIAAPTIVAPIANGIFQIVIEDEAKHGKFLRRTKNMTKPPEP
jgi:hypothetical protein